MPRCLPTAVALILAAVPALAAPPVGYYASAEGKTGEALKAALHDIIKGHTTYSYDEVWALLQYTDEDPKRRTHVILIYSGRSHPKADIYQKGSGEDQWTREHVWPKSHGFRNKSDTPYTDLHHLRPADKSVNTSRSERDFTDGGEPHEEVVGAFRGTGTFEAPDRVKGNLARALFYMAVRYEGEDGNPDLELSMSTTESGTPRIGDLCALLGWHDSDPVEDRERGRNDRVFKVQGNRNPFIDHPEFVSEIWGGEC